MNQYFMTHKLHQRDPANVKHPSDFQRGGGLFADYKQMLFVDKIYLFFSSYCDWDCSPPVFNLPGTLKTEKKK